MRGGSEREGLSGGFSGRGNSEEPESQRGESRRSQRRGRASRGMGPQEGVEPRGVGPQRRKELREGASNRRRGLTLLDEFQGLLPLVNAKLVPLLSVVQVVHCDDCGCHTDHVLLSTARGGHNEVLQPLPINGFLYHLGHWGSCSQEEGWCSCNKTHCGVKKFGTARAFPGLQPARAKESGSQGQLVAGGT